MTNYVPPKTAGIAAVIPNQSPAVADNDGAARYIGISPATLSTWRSTREVHIPFVRIGRRVAYRYCDLDAFLVANLVGAA